jgi:hypothetical protein
VTPMAKSNRDYKDEYQKFGSSLEAKKKRAFLNRLKDCPKGQDNSHQPGGSTKCEPAKDNRSKKEKSRIVGSKRDYPKNRKSPKNKGSRLA